MRAAKEAATAEEAAAQKAREEAAARKARKEETTRKTREEAAVQKAREEEATRKAKEEAAARKATEEVAREEKARRGAEKAARKAQEVARRTEARKRRRAEARAKARAAAAEVKAKEKEKAKEAEAKAKEEARDKINSTAVNPFRDKRLSLIAKRTEARKLAIMRIPTKAPTVTNAALLSTPGVQGLLDAVHEFGSGSGAEPGEVGGIKLMPLGEGGSSGDVGKEVEASKARAGSNGTADKPRLTLKFNTKFVRSVSAKSMPAPPSALVKRNPTAHQSPSTAAPSPPSRAKTLTPVATLAIATPETLASKSVLISKSGSKSAPKKADLTPPRALAPTPAPTTAPSPPRKSGKRTDHGKGKQRGKKTGATSKTPSVKETPLVFVSPKKQFEPEGWGPTIAQKEGSDWRNAAGTVLTRLKQKDTLVNIDFLLKYPELDINLTKEFSLPAAEMAQYRALVGEPIVLSTVENRLRSGQYYKCPQHFVNEVRWIC